MRVTMNYSEWCSLANDEIAALDIAVLNLTAAIGLPGAESVHVSNLVRQIDHWMTQVAANTEHWRRHFVPDIHCKTLAQFRMSAMLTVVQRDLGVRYNPACATGPYNAMDSRDNFIHGPLTGHGGTCCSLPILYLAIGRRLGYPLFAVEAKEHFFVRWDDSRGERFNIECTSLGFSARNDEYYMRWPIPLSPDEIASGSFLQNLTPRQELAQFIAIRGHCLQDNLKIVEAMEAFSYATQLDQRYRGNWAVATIMQRTVADLRAGGLPRNFPLCELIELASPTPVERWEHRALPVAQQELLRIAQLHSTRETSPYMQPETFVVTV